MNEDYYVKKFFKDYNEWLIEAQRFGHFQCETFPKWHRSDFRDIKDASIDIYHDGDIHQGFQVKGHVFVHVCGEVEPERFVRRPGTKCQPWQDLGFLLKEIKLDDVALIRFYSFSPKSPYLESIS